MTIKCFFKIIAIFYLSIFAKSACADYWLIIGTYRQGPGSKPEVSGITSPTLFALPMKDFDTCKTAGIKIINEIYKPVRNFDGKWACISDGN